MQTTGTPGATAQIVTSKDGTRIAYERHGDGPPLILVDGALGFRAFGGSRHLASLLAPSLTVLCYDRRGRGESGDRPPIALEREIEDIDALIDVAGGRASLYGISSGGALALEAASALGEKVDRLALYEIPYDGSAEGIERWHAYCSELDRLVDAGRSGDAVELFMRFVGAGDEGVAMMRSQPVWPMFESVGSSLPYDAAALGPDRVVPDARAATITASTLVMDGSASLAIMPFMRESAEALVRVIPHAEHRVIEGQGHDVAAEVIAPVLAEFFSRG